MSLKINPEYIFPFNPANDLYEKDALLRRSAIYAVESKICAIGAVLAGASIGSGLLRELDYIPFSPASLATFSKFSTTAAVAILVGGLLVTRLQLIRISFGLPLDSSNSLTQSEVAEVLSRAYAVQKIKNLPVQIAGSLATGISQLENIVKYTWNARVYFSPVQREECKSIIGEIENIEKNSRAKEEIDGLLISANRVLVQRRKASSEEEKVSKEQTTIKSRALYPKLGRFSIEEKEVGESATIKFVKYPLGLTKMEHLYCQLQKSIKGLDSKPSNTKVFIGEDATFLIENEKLKPASMLPGGATLPTRVRRNRTQGSALRCSPTIMSNLDSLE